MSMIKTTIYAILFLFGGNAYSQNNAPRELYILYKSNNKLITKNTSQKSNRTSFKILRHKYRTEEKAKKYLEEYAENLYEPIDPFVYHFIALEEPKQIDSINNFVFTSIDSVSHDKIEIGHNTKIFFIELLVAESYLKHETFLEFYE
ncbi:MAG TPA: hypothetical protein VFM80_07520 [Gracilimonas sp.]|uniref:hypothetical protein n=1 Tax=Gracilimonas sp. TaxID=1974203 RepID=UPI002DA4DB8A|nr:hypothetical protein [Gracilimonas sp.]